MTVGSAAKIMPRRTYHRKTVESEQADGSGRTLTVPLSPADPLYRLLDTLIALRLEFANDMEGEKALSAAYGRVSLLGVRSTLDRAVEGVKRVIDKANRPKPSKLQRRPLVPVRHARRLGKQ